MTASPGPFVGVTAARTRAAGAWAVEIGSSYLTRPVVLMTDSSDPDGREVRVVDSIWDATLSASYSPVERLELSGSIPFAVIRTGTGLTGVTSSSGPPPPSTALGDVRLGAAYELLARRSTSGTTVGVVSRLDAALPTGASSSFDGQRGPVLAPGFGMDLTLGRFYAAANESLRLREPVEIAGSSLGTQFVSALGFDVEVLQHRLLGIALEAWLMPSLVPQSSVLADGARITSGSLVPAEWMASVHTGLGPLTLVLGGGGGVPLSDQTAEKSDGTRSTDHFAAVTSPAFRFTLAVRYDAPLAR